MKVQRLLLLRLLLVFTKDVFVFDDHSVWEDRASGGWLDLDVNSFRDLKTARPGAQLNTGNETSLNIYTFHASIRTPIPDVYDINQNKEEVSRGLEQYAP